MTDIKSLFESIKTEMTKDGGNSNRSQFLRTEVGNTYTVRLLPNIKDPSKTFFHYYTHGWTSFATGQYINQISPQTWGERDPIGETRYRITKTGTLEEKEKAKSILRRENWLVNVYVINDPVNPDNNGTIKLLRFGRQLHKVVMEAMQGDDADELGPRIFDLSKNGVDFRIKVEKQGDFPTYVSSKFGMPKAVEGVDTKKATELYEAMTDLETVFTVKSYDELKELLNEHFFCISTDESANTQQTSTKVLETASEPDKPADKTGDDDGDEDDDDIASLLNSLDNIE
ncbi:MAG TPA: hypothetical protein DCS66_17280 [Flavobacteriaceae bacterium]|nr:hypothetical protein [Flavobacteriaceae bacterium]